MHKFFDEHMSDVVTKLDNIIKVNEGPAPKVAFFLIPVIVPAGADYVTIPSMPDKKFNEGTVPTVNLNVEMYVNIACLSKELRDKVREELGTVTYDAITSMTK
jgi:hypothetical protein